MDVTNLTAFDVRLLDYLVHARRRSSVVIASDLWRDDPTVHEHADPVGLVNMALEGLNAAGLVVMSEYQHHVAESNLVYTDVRLTNAGYKTLGLELRHHEVGRAPMGRGPIHESAGSNASDGGNAHPGDSTEFRNYRERATGDDIESMDIRTHIVRYPGHPEHRRQLEEMTMTAIRRDTPANIREGSTKDDLLRIIVDRRRTDDIDTLLRDLARGGRPRQDRHNIQHLLQSLRRSGLVTFRQKTKGTVSSYSAIEPTAEAMALVNMDRTIRGEDGLPSALFPEQPVEPPENEPSAPEDDTMEPDTDDDAWPVPRGLNDDAWPVLARLRGLNDPAVRDRITSLREAADLIDGVEDDVAAMLRAKADDLEPALTDAEHEYLRYAEEHPDGV